MSKNYLGSFVYLNSLLNSKKDAFSDQEWYEVNQLRDQIGEGLVFLQRRVNECLKVIKNVQESVK